MSRIVLIDTGRRIYRTTNEAFPNTVEAAAWFFKIRQRKPIGDRAVQWASWIALACFCVLVLGGWLPGGAR